MTRPIDNQVKSYLEYCEYVKRMTPATMVTKRKALDRFTSVNPDVDDLTKMGNWRFDEWRADLAKAGKSGKTINNYADHVACCVRFLKERCQLRVELNFDLVDRAEEDDPEVVVYSEEEIAAALEACRGPRDKLILSLAFQSGLRLTEMATLEVENIEGLALKVMGKKRKRRITFMREDTRVLLDRWLAINEITEGYVFPSPTKWDGHLSGQHIRDIIKRAFERAGVKKKAYPHAMRHTWFTLMLDKGAPLMDTSIMGGHSDPKTTRKYYHASPKRHAEIHRSFIPTANELA